MRALQVRLVKTNKTETPSKPYNQVEETFEGKTAIIAGTVDRLFNKAGRVLIAYVVVDTVRKVVIARAKRH